MILGNCLPLRGENRIIFDITTKEHKKLNHRLNRYKKEVLN